MSVKLQAFIAQAGVTSRRKAEELIKSGKVKVNGDPANLGQRINPETDKVEVSGKTITPTQELVYYLVYKPLGYVTTVKDQEDRPTVVELIPAISERVYPVGRLDIDSEGLLLLTNDGDLTYHLTHPKYGVTKTYRVQIQGSWTDEAQEQMLEGIQLKEGIARADAVKVLEASRQTTWLEIELHEGKNRQIRRMLKFLGFDTLRLIRTRIGILSLKTLKGKPYVQLSQSQIAQLLSPVTV